MNSLEYTSLQAQVIQLRQEIQARNADKAYEREVRERVVALTMNYTGQMTTARFLESVEKAVRYIVDGPTSAPQ